MPCSNNPAKNTQPSGTCFKKGLGVGFALGKNSYSRTELNAGTRMGAENIVRNRRLMRTATQIRRSSKATLINTILGGPNRQRRSFM